MGGIWGIMEKKTETTIMGYMSGCTIITGINSITTSIIAIMIVYPSFGVLNGMGMPESCLSSPEKKRQYGGFPKLGLPFGGVPILRIIVVGGLCWGPPLWESIIWERSRQKSLM